VGEIGLPDPKAAPNVLNLHLESLGNCGPARIMLACDPTAAKLVWGVGGTKALLTGGAAAERLRVDRSGDTPSLVRTGSMPGKRQSGPWHF